MLEIYRKAAQATEDCDTVKKKVEEVLQ